MVCNQNHSEIFGLKSNLHHQSTSPLNPSSTALTSPTTSIIRCIKSHDFVCFQLWVTSVVGRVDSYLWVGFQVRKSFNNQDDIFYVSLLFYRRTMFYRAYKLMVKLYFLNVICTCFHVCTSKLWYFHDILYVYICR